MNISRGLFTPRTRPVAMLAALAVAALVAGCGSSGSSSTVTIGNENSKDSTLAQGGAGGAATSTTGTETTATTPTSGPLSTEPKIAPHPGPAPTKLETKDLIVGTGPEAKNGQTITVNYVGALYHSGKVFDASWKRKEPFSFQLGKGAVIPGWDQGIPGMKVGGRRELIIPSELAYGARGSGSAIPPNSPLVFVVDLLGT